MKFILGKKLTMTQIFKDDGNVVPVTAILVEPNTVTQIKTQDQDGYSAVQVGFGRAKHINKPQGGHLKGLNPIKTLREFVVPAEEIRELKRGAILTVEIFNQGDQVKVTGVSKGKGFQGVVKRHGFHGSPATHGHKDQLRMPGSIGSTDPARVFKGLRMPGQMGNSRVTVSGLEVVAIDQEKNILYIKGAVPGGRNGLLLISGPGELIIKAPTNQPEGSVLKADPTETVIEDAQAVEPGPNSDEKSNPAAESENPVSAGENNNQSEIKTETN